MKFPHCEAIPEEVDEVKESLAEKKESTPLLRSSHAVITDMPAVASPTKQRRYWVRHPKMFKDFVGETTGNFSCKLLLNVVFTKVWSHEP